MFEHWKGFRQESPISYRQLLEALQELTTEQLDMSVTVSAGGYDAEFFSVDALSLVVNLDDNVQDLLDSSQPVILFSNGSLLGK